MSSPRTSIWYYLDRYIYGGNCTPLEQRNPFFLYKLLYFSMTNASRIFLSNNGKCFVKYLFLSHKSATRGAFVEKTLLDSYCTVLLILGSSQNIRLLYIASHALVTLE
jgi:hypothetical protein